MRVVVVGILLALVAARAGAQQPDSTSPTPLAPATVTAPAPRTEFERRMMEGKGQFISRDQLDRNEAKRLGDLIGQLRGIRVMRTGRGEAHAMTSRGQVTMRGSNVRCYVHVYLDDAPVFADVGAPSSVTGENLFNLNNVSPAELEGVEYYSGLGNIPPKYNRTGSVCGVLLLWTRAR